MGFNILIIDDSPSIVALLGAALTRAGYRTESCRNGREAVELFKRQLRIDLVICDETMPEMKGSEFALFLKTDERFREIPIILISAEQNDRFFGKLVQENIVSSYYAKPFHLERLLNIVHLLLKQSNQKSKAE